MTTIRIKNSDLAETMAIQKIVIKHGLGQIDVRQGDLLAANPRTLSATEMGFMGSALVHDIGRHLSFNFNDRRGSCSSESRGSSACQTSGFS